jgi:multiple sugar transport system permease protein
MASTITSHHAAAGGGPAIAREVRASGLSRRTRHRITVFTLMLPTLIGIGAFFVYPLLSALYFSFTKFNLLNKPQWAGLKNYETMLHDANLLKAVQNTLWLVIVMVPAQVLFGLATAVLLVGIRRFGWGYRTIFYLPALVPPVAGALAFVYVLKPGTGPVNRLLKDFGIDGPLWFNDPNWAKPSLTLLALWGIGNTMLIFLAALVDVPTHLYEAASIDGATR